MDTVARDQVGALKLVCVPRVVRSEWDPARARQALTELRRIKAQIAGAEAVLHGVLKAETGRDMRATLARSFGMSAGEASRAEQVASVVERVPGAEDALVNGHVTGEHLRKLARIKNTDEAAELLALAPSQSPDDFGRSVQKFQISRDAKGWRDRQRASRTVSFFTTEFGCVGMRAVLPGLDGERVKAAITELCNANWRAAHPDRAEVLGGHDDEPRDRRLADALVELIVATDDVKKESSARTAVIITVQAETLEAEVLGRGPVPVDEVIDILESARTDLYAAIQSTNGAVMKFGRNRRYASHLQSWRSPFATKVCAHGIVAGSHGIAAMRIMIRRGRKGARPTSMSSDCCADASITRTGTKPAKTSRARTRGAGFSRDTSNAAQQRHP